ncbi:hypothetical protein CH380_13580 [Leptospira adleri]|uniref:Uncharacterized protein n=2 Tax=Leptospira adleri TaxID=2023186 RepID=A0A2M9YMJ3_9LEPT|nr:hypothetical protein CH380_13580 [Leptospira adleri]
MSSYISLKRRNFSDSSGSSGFSWVCFRLSKKVGTHTKPLPFIFRWKLLLKFFRIEKKLESF